MKYSKFSILSGKTFSDLKKKCTYLFPTCKETRPYMKMETSQEFTKNLMLDFGLPQREVMTGKWFVEQVSISYIFSG